MADDSVCSELDDVTTADLLAELSNRHESGMVVIRNVRDKTGEGGRLDIRYCGWTAQAIGFCVCAIDALKAEMNTPPVGGLSDGDS